MKFNLVRIDDRLIHGQVALGWTRVKKINTIIAVDDQVSKDGFQCSLLQMATPPGVKSYIVSIIDAVKLLQSGKIDDRQIMLLSKGPEALIKMIEMGIEMEEVNIGNIRSNPLRKKYLSHVFATDDEIKIWKELAKKTALVAQILPDSPRVNFNDLLNKVTI